MMAARNSMNQSMTLIRGWVQAEYFFQKFQSVLLVDISSASSEDFLDAAGFFIQDFQVREGSTLLDMWLRLVDGQDLIFDIFIIYFKYTCLIKIIKELVGLSVGLLFLIMLRKSLKNFPKFILNPGCDQFTHRKRNQANKAVHDVCIFTFNEITFKSKNHFARRVSPIAKPVESTSSVQQRKSSNHQLPKTQQKKKEPHYKATQNYTFSNLDEDLEMYQGFLNIFNTHTKKAHDKLLRNQIKIIQCIIQANREDLINKFLSTNYRNRLANPQTLPLITKHCITKMQDHFDKIISSSAQCQSLLQTITLLTQFNEPQAFYVFLQHFQNKYNLSPKNPDSNYMITVLKALPSAEAQFLTLYNFLFQNKQLPLDIMKSQFFGIHTENLKFNNLGQTFYQIRKFMRRYFAFYSKKIQSQSNSNDFKTNQRQHESSSKGSSLETDVMCFLKALNYQNVRKQIEIDGFVVDFVIEGVVPKQKGTLRSKETSKEVANSTILEVMGSYHYTSRGRLKGRDVRKLILLGSEYRQKKYNVKLIHFEDLNRTRGFRNKMELIRTILEESGNSINWQPQNKGFDSQWQLKEHYEEFK